MIVWVDLETSGLEDHDRILEVACVVTDDALVEQARFHAVTSEAQNVDVSKMDEEVVRMHLASGLWQESLLKRYEAEDTSLGTHGPWSHGQVEVLLARFLNETLGPGFDYTRRPCVAGSSVWFDVAFLRRCMPAILSYVDWHLYDVSTLNEVARRAWPELYKVRPESRWLHRAVPDIEDSLALARYYVGAQVQGRWYSECQVSSPAQRAADAAMRALEGL